MPWDRKLSCGEEGDVKAQGLDRCGAVPCSYDCCASLHLTDSSLTL